MFIVPVLQNTSQTSRIFNFSCFSYVSFSEAKIVSWVTRFRGRYFSSLYNCNRSFRQSNKKVCIARSPASYVASKWAPRAVFGGRSSENDKFLGKFSPISKLSKQKLFTSTGRCFFSDLAAEDSRLKFDSKIRWVRYLSNERISWIESSTIGSGVPCYL